MGQCCVGVACLVPWLFELACLPAVADGLRHGTLDREDSNAIAQRIVQLIDHASDPAERIADVSATAASDAWFHPSQ